MTEIDPRWEKAVDRLRAGVENERLPGKVRELLEYELTADEIQAVADEIRLPADGLRGEAAELETKADAIDDAGQTFETFGEKVLEAIDRVDEWEGAEDRDDKREAREALLEALREVADAYDEVTGVELDDLAVAEAPGAADGQKLARIVWKDGQPNFVSEEGYDMPWPDEDCVWS